MENPSDRALALAREGVRLSDSDAYALAHLPHSASAEGSSLAALCEIASSIRDRRYCKTMTYSPKVFLPVTNLCRDRCTYCTFRRDPGEVGEWTMSPDEIRDWSTRGNDVGCVEALMCLGDKPEVAFRGFVTKLQSYGAASTAEYLYKACTIALEAGLLPHTNAGLLSRDELARLRPVNVSMGLMLENISPRLRDPGMPHQYAIDKEPKRRAAMIADAGELKIPFTTGILVGIGENESERIASLLAIRDLHERYGHIQEVIVQNFRAKDATPMAASLEIDDDEMVRTVAFARIILDPDVTVQAPPNLSPGCHGRLIDAGINDWGGISPVTMDYVNPEAPWPHLADLRTVCRERGYELAARLPVYPEFVNSEWLDPVMLEAAGQIDTHAGTVRRRTADVIAL